MILDIVWSRNLAPDMSTSTFHSAGALYLEGTVILVTLLWPRRQTRVEADKRGRVAWYEGAAISLIGHLTTTIAATLTQNKEFSSSTGEAVNKRKHSQRFPETINSHSSSKASPQSRTHGEEEKRFSPVLSAMPEPAAATGTHRQALLLFHLFPVTALLLQNRLGEETYALSREELSALTWAQAQQLLLGPWLFKRTVFREIFVPVCTEGWGWAPFAR